MRKLAIAAVIIAVALNLAGCWSQKNMSDLAFVMGIGFDAPPEGVDPEMNEYLSLQIAVTRSFGQEASGAGAEPVWVTSALGKGPADAEQSIARQIGRVIFYGHTAAIVVGKERAEQGLEGILDSIERFPGFRRSIRLFIVDGEAKGVLEAMPKLDQISVMAMLRMVRHTGITYSIPFGDFVAQTESEFIEGALPITSTVPPGGYDVEKTKDKGNQEGGQKGDQEGDKEGEGGSGGGQGGKGQGGDSSSQEKIIHMGGVAVFRGKKMVGSLEGTASEGFLLFKEQYRNIGYAIKTQDFGDMGVIIRKLNVKPEVNIVNDRLQIRIKTKFWAGITQAGIQQDFTDRDIRKKAARIIGDKIASDMKLAITTAQSYGADVFGFGGQLFRKNPKLWQKYKSNWPELFSNAVVHSEATGDVIRTGIIRRSN